jgi:hypothetical protein
MGPGFDVWGNIVRGLRSPRSWFSWFRGSWLNGGSWCTMLAVE